MTVLGSHACVSWPGLLGRDGVTTCDVSHTTILGPGLLGRECISSTRVLYLCISHVAVCSGSRANPRLVAGGVPAGHNGAALGAAICAMAGRIWPLLQTAKGPC